MTKIGTQSVFLIGYRGTGKSTIARELAAKLHYDWVDVDELVEQWAGKSIAAIFADEGEPAFRAIESDVVAELCRSMRTVVALGGGAVVNEANREAIRSAGVVVWLTAKPDTIAQRMAADETTGSRRPNLTGAGGLGEIETVLAAREPIYRACATFEVDTEGKTVADIVDEIVHLLNSTEPGT
jgi:shikimate kinase